MAARPVIRALLFLVLAPTLGALSAHASVDEGKRLYGERGCAGCHRIGAEGGAIGPELTHEGAAGRTHEWQVRHLLDPSGVVEGSIMPRLVNSPEEAGHLADFVMSLGAAAPPAAAEEAPTPQPETPTPEPEAPPAARIQAAPTPPPAPAVTPAAPAAPEAAEAAVEDDAVARGKAVYAGKGCVGCHRIRGAGGTLGPDLTFEGEVPGHDADWHRRHLADPRSVSPGSTMPPFRLTEGETADLVAFLTSLKRLAGDEALGPEVAHRFAALGEKLAGLQRRIARAHARGRNVDDLNVQLTDAWTRAGTVEEMVRTGNVTAAGAEIDAADGIAKKLTGALDAFDRHLRARLYLAATVVAAILFGSWILLRKIRLLVLEWDAGEAERDALRAQGRRRPLPSRAPAPPEAPPAEAAPEAVEGEGRDDAP